jgi:meiotically up-regulated gene 157 (Mug157) protein
MNHQAFIQCTAAKNPCRHRFYARRINQDDHKKFTRKWFAWANTIFGELILKTFNENPLLLGQSR